MDENDESKADL